MKKAIIDLGTNTFHLLIADINSDQIKTLYKKQIAVKLGENGINKNTISPQAFERGINALDFFSKQIKSFEPLDSIVCLGTSALRNAKNAPDFIQKAFENTGLKIEVIDGLKEAELILNGVKAALPLEKQNGLIMDIGGGSVEFIYIESGNPLFSQSYEIGASRLKDLFHNSNPISTSEILECKNYIQSQLKGLFDFCSKHKNIELLGSAGSFESIADLAQIKNEGENPYLDIKVNDFLKIHEWLLKSTLEDRKNIPAIADYRVEMIVVASILIETVISRLNIEKMKCVFYSLKEGALISY